MSNFPATTPIIVLLFTDFLGQNGLTVNFIYNLNNNDDPDTTIDNFVRVQLLKKIPPRLFINKAFSWDDTPEEYAFWQRHTINWVLHLQAVRKAMGCQC